MNGFNYGANAVKVEDSNVLATVRQHSKDPHFRDGDIYIVMESGVFVVPYTNDWVDKRTGEQKHSSGFKVCVKTYKEGDDTNAEGFKPEWISIDQFKNISKTDKSGKAVVCNPNNCIRDEDVCKAHTFVQGQKLLYVGKTYQNVYNRTAYFGCFTWKSKEELNKE